MPAVTLRLLADARVGVSLSVEGGERQTTNGLIGSLWRERFLIRPFVLWI